MTPYETRIRALVTSGQISEAEGERLVGALEGRRDWWRVLINPFDRLSTSAIWIIALVTVAASLALSRLGIRFDGALDLHHPGSTPPWSVAVAEQAVAVGLTAAVAWLASLAATRRGRLVDFVMSVGAARAPLILVALSAHWFLPPATELRAMLLEGRSPGLGLLVISLVNSVFFFWVLAVLYRGFVVSSGLTGPKAALVFGLVIIVAEVLSKVVLAMGR
jgi:hypothetical protein